MASCTYDEAEEKSPGFFMNSTIKSLSLKYPSVKNVTTSTLASWLEHPQERTVLLLDARPEEEFVVSHIEDAVRVDFQSKDMESLAQEVEARLHGKPQPTIVSYCSLGYRSSLVVQNLQNYYKENGKQPEAKVEMYNLAGSLFKWANEKRPMVDTNGEATPYAHPFSAIWGKLLNASLRQSHPGHE